MTNEEIFNNVKDKFAGVRILNENQIALLTTDGQEFITEQAQFDKEYEIRFYCSGIPGDCFECNQHGSESWQILKRQ